MLKNKNKTILKLISLLLEKPLSKEEIMMQLNISNGTVQKYVRQIKKGNFILQNKKGIYHLITFNNKTNYSKKDIDDFINLLITVQKYMPKSKYIKLCETMYLFIFLSNRDTYSFVEKEVQENIKKSQSINNSKIKKLQDYIDSQTIVKLYFKQQKEVIANLIELHSIENQTNLKYMNIKEKKCQITSIDNIIKIEPNNYYNDLNQAKETIFELNGKMSKTYVLKDNERIIEKSKDKLIIANTTFDKTKLFKRILRYETFCKILFPKNEVEEFKNLLKNSLNNIE